MSNAILFFSNKEVLENDLIIKMFDQEGFDVHCFSNIEDSKSEEVDIDYLCDALNLKKDKLYIMSDNEEFILKLYEKYSWECKGFIFKNHINKQNNNQQSCICNEYNYKFNNNLYSINAWNIGLIHNMLKNNLNFKLSESQIDNFIQSINECSENITQEGYDLLIAKGESISKDLLCMEENEQKKIIDYLKEKSKNISINCFVYSLSFLLKTYKKQSLIKEFLAYILDCIELSFDNKLFLIKQIKTTMFQDVIETDEEIEELVRKIYKQIYDYYSNLMGEHEFIPKECRNSNLIFVITPQFLSLEHGPTKTVLDRAYILQKYLNKNVIIIDTKECLSLGGMMLYYKTSVGNVIDYSQVSSVEYKDTNLSYYQTDSHVMPDVREYKNIVDMVQKYKPYMVIGIGDLILASDLCSEIVPTITVPLGNALPLGCSTFKSTYSDGIKYNKDNIIESVFTFEFKQSSHKYTREEMHFPKDKFVLTIVGGRLQTEIDEAFLDMLNNVCKEECFVAFVGGYELTEELKKKYSYLNENSINMGFQEDVLAILEVADLYVNPKRLGGGTSGLEALYKGKPSISLDYGDVAAVIGQEFCVENFEVMKEYIIRYKNDKEYYLKMSRKGIERAKYMMDSKKHFVKLYNDVVKSRLFK